MTKIDMIRLIADEGKELINGEVRATCVDTFTDKADEWTEVDKAKEETEESKEV